MKMQVIIEFDVRECDPNGADEAALERLETMAADRVCDLVQLGFMRLFGAIEANGELVIDNLMFEGEDHLLVIRNISVTNISAKSIKDMQEYNAEAAKRK